MSPIIASRITTPIARAAFSTSTKTLSPSSEVSAAGRSWGWKSLSPRTRQYVIYGFGVGLLLDSYIVVNYYPGWLGLEKKH